MVAGNCPLPLSKGLCVGIRCKHHVTMLCDPGRGSRKLCPIKEWGAKTLCDTTLHVSLTCLLMIMLSKQFSYVLSPLAISKHRMLATFLLFGTWMVGFPLCTTIARHTPMIITHAWLPDTTTCWLLLGLPGVGAGVELPCLS